MSVEHLEDRVLLVSRVFLDFGEGFAQAGQGPLAPYAVLNQGTQPANLLANLAGAGGAGQNLYEGMTGTTIGGFVYAPAPTWVPFYELVNNLNATPVPTDFQTLEVSITEQIRRALEPYDINVYSTAENNIFNFGVSTNTNQATPLLQNNNVPGDPGAPGTGGTARGPQFGSDDVYVFIAGYFFVQNNIVLQAQFPMDGIFAVNVPDSKGARPNRMDSGVFIDANYWISRVLGDNGLNLAPAQQSSRLPVPFSPGTGGSLDVAIANATLYSIGWDYGLPEVENGIEGPNTSFFDPNVELTNQANAMEESGFAEGFTIGNGSTLNFTINDQRVATFPRFNMMADGYNVLPQLKNGTLGSPPLLITDPFPLPPKDYLTPIDVPNDSIVNEDPNVTINDYDILTSDPDIGPNPDVAYVTGSGAFDQITITKLDSKTARVTVNAFDDNTYTNLIGTLKYNISLQKIITPGRLDSGQPFRIIVDGCTSDDQVILDPTLGVRVVVHGGADVKTLNITGNGVYNAQYTPDGAPAQNNPTAEAASLIPEGLAPGAAGTLVITGSTTTKTTTTTVKNGKKVTTTTTTTTPFTTTVALDHFNPANDSALQLENFNALTYKSPGFQNNEFNVTSLSDGSWQIEGQVNSTFFPPALTSKLQFNFIKQLTIDTTKGASKDIVSFTTDDSLPELLQTVTVNLGTGDDELDFDDSASANNQNYVVSPTLVLPTQPTGSPFLGFTYSGAELLSVVGTTGNNKFVVTPSTTTSMLIDGNDPPFGTLPPDGDSLAIRPAGTEGASEADDGMGNGQWTFTSGHQPITFSNIENIVIPQDNILALAGSSDTGTSKPLVKVYDAVTKDFLYSFYAYEQTFKGGVRVAVADVNGDGTPDLIVTPGAGRVAEVKVYDGTLLAGLVNADSAVADGALLADFTTEPSSYKNGLYVAAGDVDGDMLPDIITSRSRGTSRIEVFQNLGGGSFDVGSKFADFRPYPTSVVSGVVVAAADTNGDTLAEIIAAPGPGNVELVKIFDGQSGTLLRQFNGFETSFKMGVSISAADLDGDGIAEIVLGAGKGGKGRVRILDANTGALRKEFSPFGTSSTAAIALAAIDPDGAGIADLYIAQATSGSSHDVRLYDPLSGTMIDHLLETAPDFLGGIYIG